MDEEDPGLQFFPDGNVDLYGTLGVTKEATQEEIKKAYKKLALKFHPDKVLSNTTSGGGEDAIQQFQRIGFAYAVLSDEVRRRKFDNTGSTKELMIGEGDGDFDWNEYFKELWTGEVSRQTLDEFKKKYQNSAEEKEDILEAYNETEGDFAGIFEHVPCSEFLADETRFIKIIDEAIKAGDIKATATWKRTKKDEAGRKALRQKAQGEAAEAEKLAKELGVWDDLFGSGKGKGKPARGSKATSDANGAKSSKGAKSKAKVDDGDDDLSGLAALIQRKNQNRVSQFDDMIAKLEAKAGVKEKRPSDEEFDRIQAEMMARKNGGKENRGGDKKRASAGSSAGAGSSKKKSKK
ncbi:DnaJ [Kalmanozyma brasiliensis GHG001]|uniref:J domain-containing protein n=1 Tax=Kalmanozyma brasiliensis (strain GHG001) TaxID=1365824 RepID=V5ETX2_KALBG|nr:DnaJ [Kalmanozyma brasiliensis GHG001]EST08760.1 DnaJ [Kalmanozyma brasiliensis GHG001]